MSWQACAYVNKLRTPPKGEEITAYEQLVLLYLAVAHNQELGIAFPSQATIAADCKICLRHVQNLLTSLEEKGVLRVIRPEKNGRNRFLRYRFPELDAQEEKDAQDSSAGSSTGKTQENRAARGENTHKRGSKDAQDRTAIKEEQRTGTEREIEGQGMPEGLNRQRGNEVWPAILESLKACIDQHQHETWLLPLQALGSTDGVLWVQAPNQVFKEMAERYLGKIHAALISQEIHDIRTARFLCR